ncbi:MAG: GAF domain-containing SpoIIE family protein phosphatase [bacterium]
MNWPRDRLAGAVTDALMIGIVAVLAYLFYSLHLQYHGRVFFLSGWVEVFLLLGAVSGVIALYGPLEETLYHAMKRSLRPHLHWLHTTAEELYEASSGLFELDPLLERLALGLAQLTGSTRIGFFLLNETEDILVLEWDVGFDAREIGSLELPADSPLADALVRTRGVLTLPLDEEVCPRGTSPLVRILEGMDRGVFLPLRTGDALTGAVMAAPERGARLDDEGVSAAARVLDRLSVLIEDARLYALARRESLEKDLLFEVGVRLSAALERDELLELVLEGLERVVGYDAAGIFLVEPESGRITHHIARGYDEDTLNGADLKIGRGLVGLAAEKKEPILVADVRQIDAYINARPTTRSEIVLPVRVAGEVIAVINLESDRVDAYRRRDLRLLEVFGSQVAVAIQNARLYREAREKQSLEQELKLAGEIQRALLPRSAPDVPGVEVAAYFKPSRSVGGDLYDLVHLGEGRLGLAIGDVSGKGTPAAILMASLYASFRSLTRGSLTLPRIMRRLNNLLCENFGAGRYATFAYGVLDTRASELVYSNAGHFPPLLLRPGEEPIPLTEGGIVLGYIPDSDYEAGSKDLQPGDLAVFYTDGLIEATAPDGEMFGEERMVEVAATLIGQTAQEVLDGLRQAVESHCRGEPVDDDMTLVVVRITE